ncbi:hypothetical protein HK100_011986 [Physocladia obscura]|uniref:Tyrosinase copper-binding domain-containing protein n=1 Tax=Physocladia obscura TaxID=109957 RepID=A0AAD5T3C3_9FUNG|nr:hypothetical protein HK100_011986 [Physocladia obscura]
MVSLTLQFTSLVAVITVANAACTKPVVRSEWSQLTPAQKSLYVKAIQALAAKPLSYQYTDPTAMSLNDFVQTHSHNAYWAHVSIVAIFFPNPIGNAQFYPYHRALMWNWELALRSTGIWPSTIGVPYFDWSAMSQNWWTSDIFSTAYFGPISNTDTRTAPCVVQGAFAYRVVAPDPDGYRGVTSGNTTCLRRSASKSAMTDATTITQSLGATSFAQLTRSEPSVYYDTTNYHADGHAVLGGDGSDMANAAVSPNDPIFFLHHGFVDKYWWRWQNLCSAFVTDYEGNLERSDDPISDGTTVASYTQYLDSWSNFQVWDMLDTQGDTLCYTYSTSAGDLTPPTVTCPIATAVTTPIKTATVSTALASGTGTMTSANIGTSSSSDSSSNNANDNWIENLFISLLRGPSLSNWQSSANKTYSSSPVVFGRREETKATVSDGLEIFETAAERDFKTTNDYYTANRNENGELETIDSNSEFKTTGTAEPKETSTDYSTKLPTASVFKPVQKPPTWTIANSSSTTTTTTTVIFNGANHTIEIPSTHTIIQVFRGSVTAIDATTNKPKRFFPVMPVIAYLQHPDAPTGVVAGADECYLATPPELKRQYVEMMDMSWQAYLNAHNVEKMKVDVFNRNNCTTVTSPSSMMNQKKQ